MHHSHQCFFFIINFPFFQFSRLPVFTSVCVCVWLCVSVQVHISMSDMYIYSFFFFWLQIVSPCFSCGFQGNTVWVRVCMCVLCWILSICLPHTHMYMHTHMTAQQLTIILMPICLIVGFLIPRAPSSFQQGLTVLARDGFFFLKCACACVCGLVCVWCQLSHGILWFWSLSHPPFPELCFTLNISAGLLINMNYDDGYAVKQSDMNVGYRPYTPIKAEWQLKLCIDTLL